MIFTEGTLPGTYLIDPKRKADARGYFARLFCREEFAEYGLSHNLAQGNVSFNHKRGTLRGLHYQTTPHEEAKMIRCMRGALYDVSVDVRPGSPTYGQWMGVELTAENGRVLYVPEGFAHGYLTLTDETEAIYFVSSFYTPGVEKGIRYDDPAIGIDWPIPVSVVSEKDRSWPDFEARSTSILSE